MHGSTKAHVNKHKDSKNSRHRGLSVDPITPPSLGKRALRRSGGVLFKKSSMPKRLTDTGQWRDPWFRKLSPEHKSFWLFICAECDLAGVWKEDFEMASFLIGSEINKKSAYDALNDGKVRVRPLRGGYLLITDFVPFQYGVLGTHSPIHLKVSKLIESHRVSIGYPVGYTIPCKENKNKKENKDLRKVGVLKKCYDPNCGMDVPEKEFNRHMTQHRVSVGG